MPQQPVAVKTIVTTPMAEAVARDYGVELINVLTGFKYIGEKIGQLEQKGGEGRYIFGFEESYGYLSGSYVRDKDGVNASLLICEMFAWYRRRGMSLVDGLRELQRRCGVYQTKLLTYAFEGAAGFAEMERRMNALRAAPPAEIGGETVTGCLDYDRQGTGLPRSNVLRFLLEQGEAVIRPSGTEPKLKVYLTYWGENGDTMEKLCAHFDAWAR